MHTPTRRCPATLLALCTLAGTPTAVALADVFTYAVTRTMSHYQTSDAQPAAPFAWGTLAIVYDDVPNSMVSADVSFVLPPLVSYPMFEAIPTVRQHTSVFFDTEAEMLAVYPATTYTITVDHGIGPEAGDIEVPGDLYGSDTPYLTGDTFTRLQCMDSTQDFVGAVNGYTPAAGTTNAFTYVAVVQDNVGTVWYAVLTPEETAFTIPGGSLAPGMGFTIGISYINSIVIENAGFGAATSSADFIRDTNAAFSTASLPCNLADIVGVGGTGDTPACPDGQLTLDDILVFVNLFSEGTGCPGSTPCSYADVTGVGGPPEAPDGQLTLDDILAFVNAFGEGC